MQDLHKSPEGINFSRKRVYFFVEGCLGKTQNDAKVQVGIQMGTKVEKVLNL